MVKKISEGMKTEGENRGEECKKMAMEMCQNKSTENWKTPRTLFTSTTNFFT